MQSLGLQESWATQSLIHVLTDVIGMLRVNQEGVS